MGLLQLINTENDKNYISLFEAINLLARETGSNIYEVATYLLNKNTHIYLNSYNRSCDYRIMPSSYGDTIDMTWTGDNDAFVLLREITEIEKNYSGSYIGEYDRYTDSSKSTFWDRQSFFNNEYIVSALSYNPNKLIDELDGFFADMDTQNDDVNNYWIEPIEPDYQTWNEIEKYRTIDEKISDTIQEGSNIDNPAVGRASPENYQQQNKELLEKIEQLEKDLQQEKDQSFLLEMDYRSLQTDIEKLRGSNIAKDKEIKKLKEDVQKENGDVFCLSMDLRDSKIEINQLQEQIEQLKSQQQIDQSESYNLLDLIFDDTVQCRYAPDLALSIKLWEDLYINNPKNDSHKNKSDTWIKKHTPYTNESSVEVKRLREVTSPFQGWHIDRKNKFNNK